VLLFGLLEGTAQSVKVSHIITLSPEFFSCDARTLSSCVAEIFGTTLLDGNCGCECRFVWWVSPEVVFRRGGLWGEVPWTCEIWSQWEQVNCCFRVPTWSVVPLFLVLCGPREKGQPNTGRRSQCWPMTRNGAIHDLGGIQRRSRSAFDSASQLMTPLPPARRAHNFTTHSNGRCGCPFHFDHCTCRKSRHPDP
jgi:hypothetical protein